MMDTATAPRYTLLDDGTAIRCHRCDRVSHNIDDVRQRYCGQCQRFHDAAELALPAELRLLADGIAMDARMTVALGREVEPEIFVLRTTDKQVWQPIMRMGEPEDRDRMAQETRLLADEHNADAVILVSEAWALADMTDEQRAALREQHGGSFANVPGRQEILLLTVEAGGHYWHGTAPITGAGLARRCGEVAYRLAVAEHGRFTHFLTTPDEQARIAAVVARMAEALRAHGVDPDTMLGDDDEQRSMIATFRRTLLRRRTFEVPDDALQAAAAAVALQNWKKP